MKIHLIRKETLEDFKKYYMPALTYTVIKNKTQYFQYCKKLDTLLGDNPKKRSTKDEIDLLTLLIEKWDEAHHSFTDRDPIELLLSLMKDHELRAKDLVEMLDVSKGYVSDILHYKKGLSKDVIQKLAGRFKVSQEAFNRKYLLKNRVGELKNQSFSAKKKVRPTSIIK